MKSMNISRKVLFVLFTLFLPILVFTSCGYKPTNYYAKKELSGRVYVNLFVDLIDPRNAVEIKDAMNEILVQKIGSRLVYDEKLADNIMNLNIKSVSLIPIQYDKYGYNKVYKAYVEIFVSYNKKGETHKKSFVVSGENTFTVDSISNTSEINSSKRYQAIKAASEDALDEVLSKIAVSYFAK